MPTVSINACPPKYLCLDAGEIKLPFLLIQHWQEVNSRVGVANENFFSSIQFLFQC